MDGGEVGARKEKMPRKKKKSLIERGIELILAVFLAYLSGSATGVLQVVLIIGAVLVVLYAIFAD